MLEEKASDVEESIDKEDRRVVMLKDVTARLERIILVNIILVLIIYVLIILVIIIAVLTTLVNIISILIILVNIIHV